MCTQTRMRAHSCACAAVTMETTQTPQTNARFLCDIHFQCHCSRLRNDTADTFQYRRARERERRVGGVGERKQQKKKHTTQTLPPVTSPVPPKPLLDLSNVSLLLCCHPGCPVRSCRGLKSAMSCFGCHVSVMATNGG